MSTIFTSWYDGRNCDTRVLFPSPTQSVEAHDTRLDLSVSDDKHGRFDVLISMPHEVALYTLSMLALEDVLRVSQVSHAWNRLASDPTLWRLLFLRKVEWGLRTECNLHLPHVATNGPVPVIDWKMVYMHRYELDRRWYARRTKAREDALSVPFQPTITQLHGHANSVYCCCLSPSTSPISYIFTGSRDQSVCVWDYATKECLLSVRGHTGSVVCMAYRDSVLLTGSSDSTARVWDVHFHDTKTGMSPDMRTRHILRGHTGGILCICFNDTWIVTGSRDGTLRVWRMKDGQFSHMVDAHNACVNACSMDGGRVASAASNGTALIWDVATGSVLQRLKGTGCGIAAIQLSGSICFTGSSDKAIRAWSVDDGSPILLIRAHDQLVRSLHYDARRRLLLSGGWDGKVRVWNWTPTLSALCSPLDLRVPKPDLLFELRMTHSRVFGVQFDLTRILTACEDHTSWVVDFGQPGFDTHMYA